MKDRLNMEQRLEDVIEQIGELEFIRLLRHLGYKLIDKRKFYGRNENERILQEHKSNKARLKLGD